MSLTLSYPSRILVGGGCVAEVPDLLSAIGGKAPLVVTDGFMVSSGLVKALTDPLAAAGVAFELFTCPPGEPTDKTIQQGVEVLKGSACDCLIAIGGGSPMDVAKAMVVLASGGGVLSDWKVPALCTMPVLPLVCIPTTAGTGSEVSRFTVVTDTSRDPEEKMLIMGPACLPVAAVVDYELTLGLPPRQTADTGLDALTHALECYVSAKANPTSDALALSALGQIFPNLRRAYSTPDDRTAREAVMLGATQAGMAFSNASVALVHGMSRPVGAFFHVPHGMSNAMLLPSVTAFSLSAAPARYGAAARAMGCAAAGDDDAKAGALLIEALEALNKDLAVPTPKDYGIEKEAWDARMEIMAEQALASGSPSNNPRVPTIAEMVAIYTALYG
jgi:alcohol dehydrogenase class IV